MVILPSCDAALLNLIISPSEVIFKSVCPLPVVNIRPSGLKTTPKSEFWVAIFS